MFEKISPEEASIKTSSLIKIIDNLNAVGLNTHAILMMKCDKTFFETYYKTLCFSK